MRNRMRTALAALAFTITLAAEARTEAQPTQGPDKEAIGRIVRDYLLANPEVIDEAIKLLRAKREAEASARARAAIRKNGKALRAHPMSPVSGNPNGEVTVVEFFDYQCGFCKRSLRTMTDLLRDNRRVRVVWKELPILGPVSHAAARASMASHRQGRFYEFHVRLMAWPEELSEERIFEIAGEAGLDIGRLRRDMGDPAIEAYLDETRKLAQAIGIRGTPAFVIGGELVRGALDTKRMKKLVEGARSGG